MKNAITLLLVFASSVAPASAKAPDPSVDVTTVAFGSCNFQRGATDHWAAIAKLEPQLWIWAGDNIYADHLWPEARKSEYERLKNGVEYADFAAKTMIVGTWDDHDYGYNNVGKDYAHKDASRKLLLDFLDEPAGSERRDRDGVWTSHVFGRPGKQLKVILLDLRYHRDEPGKLADLLGEAQWLFLERELLLNTAQVTLLVSSTQFLPYENSGEKWADYPLARKRLLALLEAAAKNPLQKLLVLSGDRHHAEHSRHDFVAGGSIHELMSSGLTHASAHESDRNRHRVGPLIGKRNFGVVRIDWERALPGVSFEIRGNRGDLLYRYQL